MKTKMRGFVALLMAAMIMAGMIPAHSEAKKVTYYKTKKVFLQTKETKIVKTTKKIKKVVGVNQTLKGVAKGKKISGKKIKFYAGKANVQYGTCGRGYYGDVYEWQKAEIYCKNRKSIFGEDCQKTSPACEEPG